MSQGMKPKINRAGSETKVNNYDQCLTPPYALEPLIPYLRPYAFTLLWESACGKGHLIQGLYDKIPSINILASDLLSGHNFFEFQPESFDIQITNPPYSLKFQWLQRSYDLGKPFALLLPVEVIGAAKCQAMMQKYGAEIMLLDGRVNFHMPEMGWGGDGSQFPVLWYCWNLLPERLMFGTIKQAKKKWEEENKDIILVDKERVAKEKLAKKLAKESLLVEA